MNVKNLVLGIGIVVVFALVLWQGIEAFYPSPLYENFCKNRDFETSPAKLLPSGAILNCTFSKTLQEKEQQCYLQKGRPIYEYNNNGCAIAIKECDMCQKQFDDEMNQHSKIVFFVALIVGIIILIVGYAILSIEPVGSALIGSGVWSFFYGTLINWRNLTSIWRFLLLFLALVLLIWIALRINTQKQTKTFWQKVGLRK